MAEVHPWLIMMCGLPFAGKSTLAVAIARTFSIPVVSLDAINTARGIGLNGAAIAPDQWAATYAEAYRQLEMHLASGQSAIYDHASLTSQERDAVRAIAARHDAATRVIYVPISSEEAQRRLHANRTTHKRHDVRDDNFALALHSFVPPDGEPDVVRYNATVPPAAWIRETLGACFTQRTGGGRL